MIRFLYNVKDCWMQSDGIKNKNREMIITYNTDCENFSCSLILFIHCLFCNQAKLFPFQKKTNRSRFQVKIIKVTQ